MKLATYIKKKYSDPRAFWVLISVIILSWALYFAFTIQTVTNVVERRNLEQELAVLNAEIGRLEFEYIRERNSIDLAMAERFDMTEKDEPTYVTRPALGRSGGSNQL